MKPLGLAYVAALAASLVVSLTVTPALASLLLVGSRSLERATALADEVAERPLPADGALGRRPHLRRRRRCDARVGRVAGDRPVLGRTFMPEFNEGALTVAVASPPGITLAESDALGRQVEESLLAFPEVVSTSRRTGRAERDEHLQGVNGAEIEVVLRKGGPRMSCWPRCGGRWRRSPASRSPSASPSATASTT
jgi:Cu/Ag efflux pump CusA